MFPPTIYRHQYRQDEPLRGSACQPQPGQAKRTIQRDQLRAASRPHVGVTLFMEKPHQLDRLLAPQLLPGQNPVFVRGDIALLGSSRSQGRGATFLPGNSKGAPTRTPASAPDPVAVEPGTASDLVGDGLAAHQAGARRDGAVRVLGRGCHSGAIFCVHSNSPSAAAPR